MNFFQKHYEKLLLGALLLVFLILLGYILKITQDAQNISRADLKIEEPKPDYEPIDFTGDRFRIEKVFALNIVWTAYVPPGANPAHRTDLVRPLLAARCPHEQCTRFIPVYRFAVGGSCPVCGGTLTAPARGFDTEAINTPRQSDTDGDGIPDLVERQFAFLNPGNAADAKQDRDGDGFSNLYEYMKKTDMDDAKDHPPLTDLIYIESARPPQFGAQLQAVNRDRNSITLLIPPRTRGREINVGGVISVERRNFTVVDIIDDNSVRMRLDSNGQEFVLGIGATADIPEETMTVMNLGTNRQIQISVGTVLEIGNNASGKERWEVTEMDMLTGRATLTMVGNEEVTFELTTHAKIPVRARLK